MFNKQRIRSLAEAERLMDEGKVPWVWAPNEQGMYERLAVAPEIMEEFGLEQSQTVNFIILNAIAEMSLRILARKLEDLRQQIEDEKLTENFDFRSMMNDNDH